MAISRKDFVIKELQTFNKRLTKKIRTDKYCKMAISAFAFYRGTDHLFWADFSKRKRPKEFSSLETRTWLQGDLHAYNFGMFDNDHGDLVYGLNDFDEGVIADYQYDLWRMATSLILIARENGKSKPNDEKQYVKTFARAYLKQLSKLRNSDVEAKIDYTIKWVSQPLKDFMKLIDVDNKLARQKMLKKWTKNDKFNPASEKLAKVSALERKTITEAIEGKNSVSQYRKSLNSPLKNAKLSYFKVLDVAQRLLAGTGSLGTKRYYVLIEGKRARSGDDTILDVKYQGQASAYPYLNKADLKLYQFDNEAERTVEAFRALSVRTDDHLGWIKLPKMGKDTLAGYYSVRERTPEKNAYPALQSDLKKGQKAFSFKRKENFINMCRQWGEILAVSHARADNDANRMRINYSFEKKVTAITKGKEKEFATLIYNVALKYADQVLQDYKIFIDWFNPTKNCPKSAPKSDKPSIK